MKAKFIRKSAPRGANVINKYCSVLAVGAKLVSQMLPTPEIRGSNPVIGKTYMNYQLYTVLKR